MSIILLLVLLSISFVYSQINVDRKIWLYWDVPIQQAPIFYQMCYQKFKIISNKQNWTLTLLSDENINNYISNYDQLRDIIKKRQNSYFKSKVDLVKLAVLQQNGGVYFDMSSIPIFGFKWLQQLDNYPYLISNQNKEYEPQVIAFYNSLYQITSQTRNQNQGLTNYIPGYQIWFIYAKKNTTAITSWANYYTKMYTETFQQNLNVSKFQNIFHRNLDHQTYLTDNKALIYTVQKKQLELDKKLGILQHRLNANEQLKLWGLHSEYGPLAFTLGTIPKFDYIFTKSIQQVKDQFLNLKFYVKLTNNDIQYVTKKIYQQQITLAKYKDFDSYLNSNPSEDDCKHNKFIIQDSVIGFLLKDNPIAKKMKFQTISTSQRDKWESYCQRISKFSFFNSLQQRIQSFQNSMLNSLRGGLSKVLYSKLYEQNLSLVQRFQLVIEANYSFIYLFSAILLVSGLILSCIGYSILGLSKNFKFLIRQNELQTIKNKRINKISKQTKRFNDYQSLNSFLYSLLTLMTLSLCITLFLLVTVFGRLYQETYIILALIIWFSYQYFSNKHMNVKKFVFFGIRVQQIQLFIEPIVYYSFCKSILYSIQKRQEKILPQSIIIALITPQFFSLAQMLFQKNQINSILEFILKKSKVFIRAFIIIFMFSLILIPNLKFIANDNGYISQKYVFIPLFYAALLYILVSYEFIAEYYKRLKSYLKKNKEQNQQNPNSFKTGLGLALIKFLLLSIAIIKTIYLYHTYKNWMDSINKVFLQFFMMTVFIIINMQNSTVFYSRKNNELFRKQNKEPTNVLWKSYKLIVEEVIFNLCPFIMLGVRWMYVKNQYKYLSFIYNESCIIIINVIMCILWKRFVQYQIVVVFGRNSKEEKKESEQVLDMQGMKYYQTIELQSEQIEDQNEQK